jgi:hypothetical protein
VQEKNNRPRQPARSFLLVVLVCGYLIYSLTGWLRLSLSIEDWNLLISYGLFPGPLYLAIVGLITGLFGAGAVVSLWFRWTWAPAVTFLGTLAAAAWYWLDRLFFTRSEASWANWPFSVVITIGLLLFVFLALPLPQKEIKKIPVRWGR